MAGASQVTLIHSFFDLGHCYTKAYLDYPTPKEIIVFFKITITTQTTGSLDDDIWSHLFMID